MDTEKFVSDLEEMGRQVDRGLGRAAGMLDLIEQRMAYGDWLVSGESRSGWLIGDEVIPVVVDDRLPPGVVLAQIDGRLWWLRGAGVISADEFRRKWAQSGVSDRANSKKTG